MAMRLVVVVVVAMPITVIVVCARMVRGVVIYPIKTAVSNVLMVVGPMIRITDNIIIISHRHHQSPSSA